MVIAGERFALERGDLCFVDLGLVHGRDHAAEYGEGTGVQPGELHAHVRVFQLRGAHGRPRRLFCSRVNDFSFQTPAAGLGGLLEHAVQVVSGSRRQVVQKAGTEHIPRILLDQTPNAPSSRYPTL